jgi:tetratricopeptide (TPR) repeat protein
MIASLILLTASVAQLTLSAPAKGAEAVTSQPALARQKIAEGDRKWKEKNYRDASVAYQDAVDAEPNSIEALFKLGNANAMLGYYRQAIDRWNRVLELTSDAAVKKSAEGNIAKAQAKMAKSRPTTPGPARNSYEEGVKQINSRNYTGAVENLTQAIRADPNLAVAYVARGSAYIGLRRYSDAAADYQQAHKLEPTLSAPLYGLAEALRGLGRSADARQYYEKYAQSKATDVRPELQARAREQAAALR